MIWKLSLTGIKSRFKDYAILFSGLVVASMIFYMFLTLAINPGFGGSNVELSPSYLRFTFGFGLVLLALITFIYLAYANSFLLSMRQHDYGMYMMLGAKSSRIGLLIFIETLVTGVLAAILGILIGFALTAGVSSLLITNLGIKITNFQVILPMAIVWTLIFFIAIFFISATRNARKLTRSKVIDLLHEEQKPLKVSQNRALRLLEAVFGLIFLAIGYYVMGMRFNQAIYVVIPVAFVTIVVGTYFVFDALCSVVIDFLLQKPRFAYKRLRMFTLGQLKFRLRDYTKLLAVVSLLFALALGAITVGQGFDTIKDQAAKSTYYDDVVAVNSKQVTKQLKKVQITDSLTYQYKETPKGLYFQTSQLTAKTPKTMEFVQTNGQPSYKERTLKFSEIVKKNSADYYSFTSLVPNADQKQLYFVSDADFIKVAGKQKTLNLIRIQNFAKNYETLSALNKMQIKEAPETMNILRVSKPQIYQTMIGFVSGFEFMGFFLGLAFLTMLASTLMFKVLSGAKDDRMRYLMLYKIGTRKKLLRRSIACEIGVLFFLPGLLGIIDVLFGLKLFQQLLPHVYAGLWLPFGIFIVLYLIYYFITVKLYEHMVLQTA